MWTEPTTTRLRATLRYLALLGFAWFTGSGSLCRAQQPAATPALQGNLPGLTKQLDAPQSARAASDVRTAQILSLLANKVKADEIAASAITDEEKTAAQAISERSERQMSMVSSFQRQQIYNGIEVAAPYPFQVAIELTKEGWSPYDAYLCGATLIDPSWVLTAFHCAPNKDHPSDVWVWAGSQYLKTNDGTGRILKIDGVVPPPETYDANTGANDIALLHLVTPVTDLPTMSLLDENMEAAALAASRLGLILGWGAVDPATGLSDKLRYNYVPIRQQSECASDYAGKITDKSLCAGGSQVGICGGDSGGPLLLPISGSNYAQVGVTSTILGPCGGFPALFTRISSYVGWIRGAIAARAGQ
jgi:hypothetical protein